MNGPHLERLLAVAAAPKARLVAVAGRRDMEDAPDALTSGVRTSVHVFQLGKSAKSSFTASLANVTVQALLFLRDDLLLAGTDDGRVLAFDPTSGSDAPSAEWKGDAPIAALSATASGLIAAADRAGAVHLLDATLAERASRKLTGGALGAVCAEGGVLVAAGSDGVVRAVTLERFADGEVREMPVGSEAVTALAITDDSRVVAGLADGSVVLCFLEGAADVEDRSAGAPHDAAVRGLVVLPEQEDEQGRELPRRLLSLSEDGALKTWELDSRRRPKTVDVPARATGLALARPTRGAAEQAKAGTLALASEGRTLTLLNVDANGQVAPWATVESRLAQLDQDLRARSDTQRQAAIAELATLPEDDARIMLERALVDRQPKLQALAASVLGDGMRRLSRPALRTALDGPDPAARKAAFAALRRIDEATPLSAMRPALSSKHWDVRKEAVERLPSLRAVSPLVPGLVADALKDERPEVRASAFEALFSLSEKRSLAPIVSGMRHGPEDVRVMALVSLARHGARTDDGRDILERALDDASDKARQMAFFVAVSARPALRARLASVDERARKELARLAARAGVTPGDDEGAELTDGADLTDDDKQPLFAALAARSPDSALRGARALGLLADRRASGALLSLSREADASLRLAAVEGLEAAACAMPHDTRLTARLEWLLDDAYEQVRAASFDALLRIGAPEGAAGELALSATALGCKSADVRLRALPLLTRFGGAGKWAKLPELPERADLLLGDALDDEGEKVRAEAFRTLWSWHSKAPQEPLTRAARSRHPDIRGRAATELGRVSDAWAEDLLLELAKDTDSGVGRAAFDTFFKKSKKHGKDARLYLAVLGSPRPELRAVGCQKSPPSVRDDVLATIVALVSDENHLVHTAAIEAVDRLKPDDLTAFGQAFASPFYGLRVRAGELCGRRRDERAIEPMQKLLSIPAEELRYPPQELRRRAAAALADVGAPKTIDFLTALLQEEDGFINEQAARGLATAARPGSDRALVDALSHGELAVRSWVAEGLARLGDTRAVPVLAGSLAHDHRPIRLGAIMGYVALGADGVRGILAGLDDDDRHVAELCFAVVVARDVALVRAGLPPDLLLSVLGSAQPELRFLAARLLELRDDEAELRKVAAGLVGPPIPERASDMKDWPEEDRRRALVEVIVGALASDHPAQRYAATQVLALRTKPRAFWREAARMQGPALSGDLRIPHTNWDAEPQQPQKRGWLRALFSRSGRSVAEAGTERVLEVLSFVGGKRGRAIPVGDEEFAEHQKLAFGTYVGLVRQAPAHGAADITHRVRRDSIGRLAALASADDVGRDVVLPALRQSLNDPNHLVRRAAIVGLRGLYPDGSTVPLALMLDASAADVGKAAVDALLLAAQASDAQAAELVRSAIDAPVADVRKHALATLPRLFEAGSAEPFILALSSSYADVRLAVVDRLVDSTDARVKEALTRAMESTHEDLRLKAASALAHRGDVRTVDVLAGLLRSERGPIVTRALEALVALAHARPSAADDFDAAANAEAAAKAAAAVGQRIQDDPDKTADRRALIDALGRVGSPEAAPVLLEFFDEGDLSGPAFVALRSIALDRDKPPERRPDGTTRHRYDEPALVGWLAKPASSAVEGVRLTAVDMLRTIEDPGAEVLLAGLLSDRSTAVRAASCEALAYRVEHFEGAGLDTLAVTLRGGRREMVLPAAIGLATKQRPEAFQALLLVLKAGLQDERTRAVLALGSLGDARAVEELRLFIDPTAELEPDDAALAPFVARAFGRLVRHLPADADVRAEVRGTLERLAAETVGQVRFAALTGLREAGDERSRALLEKTAADTLEDARLRRHVIDELALLGEQASEGLLADLLRDAPVRDSALTALERLFPADRTRTSLHALGSDDSGIQARGAAYLTRHGEASTLVKSLSQIDDASVRATLRRGLVQRSACPVDALRDLLGADGPGQRADAAWIAGAAPAEGKALAPDIAQAMKTSLDARGAGTSEHDETMRACLWAASALGASMTGEARDVLGHRDIAAGARREAVRHLAQVGDAKDRHLLEEAALDLDGAVRVVAAAALAASPEGRALFERELVDGAAVAPIVATLRAEDEAALYTSARRRQLSLPTVFRAGRAPGLHELARASGEGDERLAAIAALGRLGGDAAAASLTAIVDDDAEASEARGAAFRSLRRLQRRAQRLEKGHAS